jgi:hypothetical protein
MLFGLLEWSYIAWVSTLAKLLLTRVVMVAQVEHQSRNSEGKPPPDSLSK